MAPDRAADRLSRRALLWGLGALSLRPWPARALSAALRADVHAELHAPEGWTSGGAGELGVSLHRRPVRALGLSAWRADATLDPKVKPATFFGVLSDIEAHLRLTPGLVASTVFLRDGDHAAFFQVLGAPPMTPVADRFWISESRGEARIGGDPDRYRRSWSTQAAPRHDDVRAQIFARFPGAVEIGCAHGFWDLRRGPSGALEVSYRLVSDPGGSLPKGVASTVAGRGMPQTIRGIEREALRRG
jgi:hypothetical protein